MNKKPALNTLQEKTSKNDIDHCQKPGNKDNKARRKPLSLEKHGNHENDETNRNSLGHPIEFLPQTTSDPHAVQSFDRQNNNKEWRYRERKPKIIIKGQVKHPRNVRLKKFCATQKISGGGRQKYHHEIHRELQGTKIDF
jgi:hypothetical protein